MRRRHPTGLALIVVTMVCVLLAGNLEGQIVDQGRGYPGENWPFVGGNWASARYSTLDEITAETIDRLGAAWVTRLPGGAASRATPVVQDGVMYLTGGANVFAMSAETGALVWRWQPGDSADELRRVPSWQGVALGDGLVFVGLRSAEVAAFRQDTGELVWVRPVGSIPYQRGESVTTAPMYAHGTVFVGLANGDTGGQGRIIALDATTGDQRWTFFVVPRPGEFGHDTWPQDSNSWELGGGGVWLVGTIDPDLGLVYFSTGNPVPMFGGEIRAGDNLFTASVLALDIETGERRWHYQVVRHDVWDADIATPLLLYEAEIDGEPRKALAAMRADGLLFLFDRETGTPLTQIEERPVPQDPYQRTASTQPFPIGVESILPDCSFWRDRVPPPFELSCSAFTPPSINQHAVVAPGVPIPRVRVTPMSFSPQTGYIYAQGRAMVGRARRFEDPWWWRLDDNELTLPDPVGIIAAVDTQTSKVVWKHEVPAEYLGTSGPLTTAGGLMFRGSAGGQVEAFDAKNGHRMWTFRTSPRGGRVRPGPAASYELAGHQFVTISMGSEVWAFTLDGTIPARGEAVLDPWDNYERPRPAPRATNVIETATNIESPTPNLALDVQSFGMDEHRFNPVRALVTAGTSVRFINNGDLVHTIAARDGSWTTERVEPGMEVPVNFDSGGTFLYHCTEHPWAIGEITVEP